MSVSVDVPLNTMLADLDDSLRTLLQREFARHGFDKVDVSFDAPARDWASQLSAPTVNLFLYDLRESSDHRHRMLDERRRNGLTVETRPPLILECSYAMTAWTKAVDDEHRLMSQLLAILYAYPRLPDDVLPERLSNGAQRYPIFGRVGQARAEGKADFWNAVGGQYKPSLDYVVTLSCEAATTHARGPEARNVAVRVGDMSGSPGSVTEMQRIGGTITDGEGEPIADAWIRMPDLGRWASTDEGGRYEILRVPPGVHRCVTRTPTGVEVQTHAVVPGGPFDVVVEVVTSG